MDGSRFFVQHMETEMSANLIPFYENLKKGVVTMYLQRVTETTNTRLYAQRLFLYIKWPRRVPGLNKDFLLTFGAVVVLEQSSISSCDSLFLCFFFSFFAPFQKTKQNNKISLTQTHWRQYDSILPRDMYLEKRKLARIYTRPNIEAGYLFNFWSESRSDELTDFLTVSTLNYRGVIFIYFTLQTFLDINGIC